MPKFTVHFTTTASASVDVEIPEETIAEEGVETAVFSLIEGGMINTPSICARCSGWGRDFGLSIDGEWFAYQATDENGNVVYDDGKSQEG